MCIIFGTLTWPENPADASSEVLNSKIFLGDMPPDPTKRACLCTLTSPHCTAPYMLPYLCPSNYPILAMTLMIACNNNSLGYPILYLPAFGDLSEVIKRAARVHRHLWLRNYAVVVAGDLDIDTSCLNIFSSTTRHRIWSHHPWNALYCKGCYPWEKTLKNRKTHVGGDDKLWIQFAPPYTIYLHALWLFYWQDGGFLHLLNG